MTGGNLNREFKKGFPCGGRLDYPVCLSRHYRTGAVMMCHPYHSVSLVMVVSSEKTNRGCSSGERLRALTGVGSALLTLLRYVNGPRFWHG